MPMLPVPLVPQWGDGANLRRNDCGIACVAMLLSYYGKLDGLSVDVLTRQTGLASSDSGLTPLQVAVLGQRHTLPLTVTNDVTLDAIRAEIDAGHPVIALVAYRFILSRLDQADNVPGKDLHYLVVLGYDDTHFVINDPDTWRGDYGRDTSVSATELDKALAGAQYRRQCVCVGDVHMTPKEQVKALLAQAAAIVDTIDDTPPTLPEPPTKYAAVDQLNIRGGAGTTFPILRALKLGEAVNVLAISGKWARIDQPMAGYVYDPSLSVNRPNQ